MAIWGAVRFVLAFAGVLLLAAWVSRWLAIQSRGARGSAVTVVGAVGLGGPRQVCAVRIGRRVLVLGLSDKQVQLLCEIADPAEIAEILGPSTPPAGGALPFARALESALARLRHGGRPDA